MTTKADEASARLRDLKDRAQYKDALLFSEAQRGHTKREDVIDSGLPCLCL